jgi:hypothetical protein
MEFQIHFFWFFLAFSMGIIYAFLGEPNKKQIIKYPTPYNSEKITYKGLSGDCYKFKSSRVECTNEAKHQTII